MAFITTRLDETIAMHRRLTISILLSTVAFTANGAEVALRQQAAPRGPVVLLGDVAHISADGDAAILSLAATPLMPAPAPGTEQFLRVAELRDLLAARGLDIRGLRFTGAQVIKIGEPAGNSLEQPQTDAAALPADDQAAGEQLAAAIADHLRRQTGHDLWNVNVDADDDVVKVYLQRGGVLTISGGKSPWTGRQRFTISKLPGMPAASAYARVERLELAVVALRSIERGELVRRTDVELRPHAGALPPQSIVALEAAVGKEAIQTIRADSLVQANQVRTPIIVRRGERVSVRARTGGITVRTYAVAQQDGGLGDLVTVQSLAGKERYAARVAGLRELEVMAAGVSADDVAGVIQR